VKFHRSPSYSGSLTTTASCSEAGSSPEPSGTENPLLKYIVIYQLNHCLYLKAHYFHRTTSQAIEVFGELAAISEDNKTLLEDDTPAASHVKSIQFCKDSRPASSAEECLDTDSDGAIKVSTYFYVSFFSCKVFDLLFLVDCHIQEKFN